MTAHRLPEAVSLIRDLPLQEKTLSQLPLVDHQALRPFNRIPIRQIKNQSLKPTASISSSLENPVFADASGCGPGSSR